MMRFTTFLETRLNPGMRDIGDISLYLLFSRTGYAKLQVGEAHSSPHHPQPLHTHAYGIYIVVRATEHRHPIPPEPSDPILSLYLSCLSVIEFPGKP